MKTKVGLSRFITVSGYSLVEVLVGLVLTSITLGLSGYGVGRMFSDTNKIMDDFSTETEMYQLLHQILQTGRSSESCEKLLVTTAAATVTDPASTSLECSLKQNPDDPATRVRFRKIDSENQLRFEKLDAGIWILNRSFGGDKFPINEFLVCKWEEITANPVECTISGSEIGRVLQDSGFKSRYFRFGIKATHPNGIRMYDYQTAFYVRNPAPAVNLSYLWGNK